MEADCTAAKTDAELVEAMLKHTRPVGSAATTHDRAPLVSPGSKCPTCERRIPHPKKDTSPQTKVVSIRVPIDDAETFKEMLEAAASHLGLLEKPHSNYWTVLHGLVLSLQGHGEEG